MVITSALLTTAVLSRKLQYESLDLNDAAEYCEATITNLKGWKTEPHNENQNERNEEKHEQPSETEFAKQRLADLLGVEQAWPRYMCRKPAQRELYSSVVEFYKNNIFVPFLTQ